MFATLLLIIMLVLAAVSAETGLKGAVALAVVALVWFPLNGQLEGFVIVSLTRDHGVTGGDVVGLVALAIAAWRGWQAVRLSRS